MPKKSLFKTKTAFAQYALATAGAVTAFWPDAVPWVTTHIGVITIVAAVLNLIIRKLTHEEVALFAGSDDE